MKFIKYIVPFLLLGVISCQEYEDFNSNPNAPTDVQPSVLFPSAIRQSVNVTTEESFLLGNNAAQLTTKTLRTEIDDYNWNAFPTVWEGLYESVTDIRQVEKLAIENGNDVLLGAAITFRSWIFSVLTNAYGDIPYSEAVNVDEINFTPAYDQQSEIIPDILDELGRADELIASGNGSIEGDVLFGGSAMQWRKFTNSLRLRLLMRANNQIGDANTRFADIVANQPIMESNADGAVLDYLSDFANQFPLLPIKDGDFAAVALSQSSYNVLSATNDPRLSRYARPDNDDYNNPTFTGAENGAGSGACNKTGSALGAKYYNDPNSTKASELGLEIANGIIMTYSELEFTLAEAAAKGWISDDVEPHYRAGLEASMDYYNVDYAPFGYTNFEDYYTNSGIAYDGVTTDIWEQKWLSMFFTGLEPYFEVRRWYYESGMDFSGIPFLSTPCQDRNGGELPMKFLYPGEEQSLNQENYNAAVERIGGSNSINVPIWLVE